MNKLEFSDINKFFTSLGIILIIIGTLLPWFINQNLSVVFINQDEINQSSDIAKEIILNQQTVILFLSEHLLIIVLILVFLGAVSICYGLWRWNARQKIKDQTENEILKEKQIKNVSEKEKERDVEEDLAITVKDKPEIYRKYRSIENSISVKLAAYSNVNYDTFTDKRIGKHNYDIIIQSKNIERRSDLIIEVKYYNRIPVQNKPRIDIDKFLLSILNYENTQGRQVIPIIMFVFNNELNLEEFNLIKEKLKDYSFNVRPNLRIKVIKEDDIDIQDALTLISQ
jgi:hypothetical protein